MSIQEELRRLPSVDRLLQEQSVAALIERWGHDLITISFSYGWGSPQQPDIADALFRLSYWQEHSELFVFALIDGPFSALIKAWNWQEAVVRLTKGDPEVSQLLADAVLDLETLLAEVAAAGADGIIIGEDIAIRRGPIVRPPVLQNSYFPFLQLLVLAAQERGLPVVFHSDGNLWPIWDDILETGVNGIQGLDPYSAMSLPLARARSGNHLCLWGNVDLGWLAHQHDSEAIQTHLHEMLSSLRGTPVIFGTSSGLAPGIPLAHLDSLYAAAHTYQWHSQSQGRVQSPPAGF